MILEEVYGIKISRFIVNVCIYFITSIPTYIILFEKSIMGFCTILLIENIMTYYLFEDIDILALVEEELSSKQLGLLLISIIIAIGVFIWVFIKHQELFWILVITEIIFKIISRQLKKIKTKKNNS